VAKAKKSDLDLTKTLNALDNSGVDYYNDLTPEERKSYSPLVLMRYMSSLGDQSKNQHYAILATNDIVNIGFWNLSKHPELQHQLLCLTGVGGRQYRPWISAKSKRSQTKLVDAFILEIYPWLNSDELELMKSSHNTESFTKFVMSAGKSDSESKAIIDDWKKVR